MVALKAVICRGRAGGKGRDKMVITEVLDIFEGRVGDSQGGRPTASN